MFNRLSTTTVNKEQGQESQQTKVTFNLTDAAADKLLGLVEAGDEGLRELGIGSLQIEDGQIVGLSLLENNGEREDTQLAASKKTPDKSYEDKYSPSKNSESSSQSSISSLSTSSFSGLQQLGSLLQQSNSTRDYAALLKHSSFLSAHEQSVLKSYLSSGGPISESLLVNLMSQNNLNHLHKDNGEPVNKKSRKLDSTNKHSSHNSKLKNDISGASFNTNLSKSLQKQSGFSLMPVNNSSINNSQARTNVRSHNDLSKSDTKSSSALRLASLPGVSLTAVTTTSRTDTSSVTTSSGGLMPPPSASSVTLSPVPRSSSSSSTSSESGDSKSSSSWRHSLDNNISLSQSCDSRPLLINPVTGQFESGGASEHTANDIDSSSCDRLDGEDLDEIESSKVKLGSQSPGTGNSTSEPSLKFKLKVSSTVVNNSSNKSASPKLDTKNQSSSGEPEPKIPKLKIRLNKSVKLNNQVRSPEPSSDPEDDNNPHHNDLKIKIKPMSESSTVTTEGSAVITSPYFPTLSSNIVNHTNLEDRKKKKKDKDRMTVWTESLAKHGQRAERDSKDDKSKDNKSWPEVLESRLFGGGGGGGNSVSNTSNNSSPGTSDHDGLTFSGYDMVLANQTEGNTPPGKCESDENSDKTGHHLNCQGPGGRALPGPGHTPTLTLATPNQTPPASHNTVLDILEGRPALGEPPMSPDSAPRGSQSQQGEDSGIESMDSRSEKSPNQGESPFHGSNESDMCRTPTYSSSMGPSGKLSPTGCDQVSDTVSSIPTGANTTQTVQSVSSEALKDNHIIGRENGDNTSNGDETKVENGEYDQGKNESGDTKAEEVLLRSCDGADDPNSLTSVTDPSDKPAIDNCMHDYTRDKVSSLSKVSAPVVTTVNVSTPRSSIGLTVPPGARMVPVKLVSVPGTTGNVRMLRVSPVKSVAPGSLPPRTVVIKSSVLKTVSTTDPGDLSGNVTGAASLIKFPVPPSVTTSQTSICDIPPVETSHSSTSASIVTTNAAPLKSQPSSLKTSETEDNNSSKVSPHSLPESDQSQSKSIISLPSTVVTNSAFVHEKCNLEEDDLSPTTNSHLASSGDFLKNENSDGESLLRPLLFKEDEIENSSLSSNDQSKTQMNTRKRTRRDTDSDKSDKSVTGDTAPSKKSKISPSSCSNRRKKSPVSHDNHSKVTGKPSNNKLEVEDNGKNRASSKSLTNNSYGLSSPEGQDHNVNNIDKSKDKTAQVKIISSRGGSTDSKTGAKTVAEVKMKKVGDNASVAAKDSGRRVSARTRKPEEGGVSVKRR